MRKGGINLLELAICHLPTYFGEELNRDVLEEKAYLLPPSLRSRLMERNHLPSLRQSLGGLLLLRYLIGAEAFDEMATSLVYDKSGRPYIKNGSLDFNISHHEEYAICAIEHSVPGPRVGVDIQSFPNGRNVDQIARRFFTPREYDYYTSHFDTTHAFLRVWTRKEALSKYFGDGLNDRFHKNDTLTAQDRYPIRFDEYTIGDNYVVTFCHNKNAIAPEQNDIKWMA